MYHLHFYPTLALVRMDPLIYPDTFLIGSDRLYVILSGSGLAPIHVSHLSSDQNFYLLVVGGGHRFESTECGPAQMTL